MTKFFFYIWAQYSKISAGTDWFWKKFLNFCHCILSILVIFLHIYPNQT